MGCLHQDTAQKQKLVELVGAVAEFRTRPEAAGNLDPGV